MDVSIVCSAIDDIIKWMPSLTTTSSSGPGLSSSDREQLENHLTQIKKVVQNHKQNQNHAQGHLLRWLRQLKSVVNDLNDLVEELSPNASRQESTKKTTRIRSYLSKSNPIRQRLKLTQKINVVKKELQRIATDGNAFSTLPASEDARNKGRKLDAEFEKRLGAVGREKEKKEIIDQLILHTTKNGESARAVFTLVGVAGIGKTKLARLAYEDEKVNDHFGSLTWVDGIHEAFDVESIAKRVTDSAGTDNKRYLLVLDDLRVKIGGEALTGLQNKLEEYGLSGGAILITTRSIFVARVAATASPVKPCTLQGLDDGDSWTLFQNIAGQYANNSRKIVGKCRGVPLAIITMAKLLHARGSQVAEDEFTEEFLQELTWSYYEELPTHHHKLCFAYCSLFPEDYLFDTERLIHLWMGEGFLTPWIPSTEQEEDIGRGYINEFLESSIFQDVKEDECGVVRSCRMHRLMHDLARFVADEYENIIMDPDGQKVHEGVLRASFDYSLDVSRGIPDSLFGKAMKLRTILLAPAKTQLRLPQELKMNTSTCQKIFTTFEILRVLDLHDLGIKTVPSSIAELKNLRDLDLSQNNMEKLPSAITKLSNLQSLKLSQCHLLKELPKDIEDLISLRHVDIEGCLGLTHMPHRINKLSSLQTLPLFVASKHHHVGGLKELAGLNNLRGHLEILHLERLKFPTSKDDQYLKKKEHLERLTLRWDHEDEEEEEEKDDSDKKSLECLEPHPNLRVLFLEGYQGHTLSHWLPSIVNLVRLSLYDCPSCKILPPLDQLQHLMILELLRLDSLEFIAGESDNSTNADTSNASSSASSNTKPDAFFPSLKELTIADCSKLKSWWKTEKDRPSLFFACISKLQVRYCPNLTRMPLFPRLDNELVLVGSSVQPLQDSIRCRPDGEGFVPFSKLKSMQIASSNEHSPPVHWIRNFVSLENLHIRDCPLLEFLPEGFKHLSSLQYLTIENCKELDLDRSSTEWEGLKNLRSLTIREIPKLRSLPLGVDKVISLKDLELHNCLELTFLPESIGNLNSLGKLVISECNKLASLPKGMEKLKSLHTLIMLDCKLLLPRCQPETGDDWPQIKHIKKIQVKETRDL